MKRTVMALFTMISAAGFMAATAYAQEPTPPAATLTGFSPDVMFQGLTGAFWMTLVVTLVAGAIGGIVYELLILQGNVEMPHKPTKEEATEKYPYAVVEYVYDLGIWARIIIGALAAVAALLVLSPSTTFGLLATALVAGSAGTSIFRSLQDRLLASIAQKEAADTKAIGDKLAAKVGEAEQAYADLKGKLVTASTSLAGTSNLSFAPTDGAPITLDLDDLNKVERLLNEAKGIHEAI